MTMPYDSPEKDAKWREENREHLRRYHRQWVLEHPESVSDYSKQNRMALKVEVLARYGKNGELKCCWDGCEVTDVDVLTLDHIDNDGARKRKAGEKTGYNGYRNLRALGYPDGYQTLCANHQMKKELLRRRVI